MAIQEMLIGSIESGIKMIAESHSTSKGCLYNPECQFFRIKWNNNILLIERSWINA